MTDAAITGPRTAPVPFTCNDVLLALIAVPGAERSSVCDNSTLG